MDTDTTTLLDLIALIDDDRRFHQAAALLAANAEDKAQYAHQSRCEASVISRIRRGMARKSHRRVPLPRQKFDDYVDDLINTYLERIGDSEALYGVAK